MKNADILSNLLITRVHSAATLYTPQYKKRFFRDRTRWAIVVKYEGETVYFSNGKRFLSNASHLTVLPKGCTYQWECTQEGHFFIIEFDSPVTHPEPLTCPVKNCDKILKICKELECRRNPNNPLKQIESFQAVYTILLLLLQSEQEQYTQKDRKHLLTPALEYMMKNYHQPISNDELAQLTGLSTVYFRKLFTEFAGISPIAYLHQIRIEKAKEMLRSDYGTLTDIARSLGYANLYDFSRDFKKRTGVSPSKY